MSGDVQPRKRKDKKRKKDDLGVDEPRGTAAALGEGDVFMHSHHDHGTGGHWCAKVIFFFLLFVLVGLIGLIILENRGLSELEANAVQSQYSGVLEGWLEDAPEDDHHDEHTLELKHHDDDHDDDEHGDEVEHSEEAEEDEHDDEDDEEELDDHDDEEEHDDDVSQDDEDDDDTQEDNDDEDDEAQEDESQEQDLEANDEEEDLPYRKYYHDNNAEPDDEDDDDEDEQDNDLNNDDDEDEDQEDQSNEVDQNDDENDDEDEENNQSVEQDDNDDDDNEAGSNEQNDEDEEDHEEEEDTSLEVERIEKEAPADEEPISVELPALEEQDDDDDDKDQESAEDEASDADDADETDVGEDADDNANEPDDDFLEADDDEPPIERITAPAGKPFAEVEEETSSEKPTDTLADEEEYEKRQEDLRRQEAEASHKDGGNSIEDEWPGEPADAYWRQQLDDAEREFNQGEFMAAADRASAAKLQASGRAKWLVAKALDALAEKKRDNALLGRAIAAYLELLKMNERLSDKKLLEISERAINRMHFRGTYLSAEPVYRLLIRRFPNEPAHRTNLTVTFLMANRGDLAEGELKETLKRWPNDRLALAQYGFILKTQHNKLEEALDHLQRALEGDTGPATEPRFYYHLGDTLLLLGRFKEAHEVHKRGAAHGHFLSASQRSLYNVPRLKGQPWWKIEDTPYVKLARSLEKNWQAILKEGEAAKSLYEQEKEGLKERGEWSQLDLFVRGREIPDRCSRAPVTCSVVKSEVAAACRRGQIKFSLISPGTHVRPHVGPTNCRLRMHLGLSNTKDTFIRVDQETRQWKTGKVLVFDDSFEHEVWHNGSAARLVLIVDVWHPELSAAERRHLPAI